MRQPVFLEPGKLQWREGGPALPERPGACVLVLGDAAPVIGIYAAGMAVALGAGSVHFIDSDIERRRRATDYGAYPSKIWIPAKVLPS